ncbi:unnamed protein product [Musa textilis]
MVLLSCVRTREADQDLSVNEFFAESLGLTRSIHPKFLHPLISVSPFSHQLIMQLIKGTSACKHGASRHMEKLFILSNAMTWEVTIITQLTNTESYLPHFFWF